MITAWRSRNQPNNERNLPQRHEEKEEACNHGFTRISTDLGKEEEKEITTGIHDFERE
jgi:hypothetical protein